MPSSRTAEPPQDDHGDAAAPPAGADTATLSGPARVPGPTPGTGTGTVGAAGTETDVDTDTGRSWQGIRALVLRLHFYAGVFVAPFLIVAALTGLAYTLTPQLDQFLYGDQLRVDQVGEAPLPLAEQIAAARSAHPEGTLASVVTPPGPEDTTRVVLSLPELGEKQRTVFVDPYTAEVQGELTTWFGSTPVTTWLDDLHRNLHLGETGRLYSEVAASWLWLIVAGGLLLWLGRSRGQRARSARGVLLPERAARGVRRTRGLHAVTGLWLAVGLFFLSATGLTWSHHAGERFDQLLDSAKGNAPILETRLPGAAQTPAEGAGEGGEHAGHGGAHHHATSDPGDYDKALAAAREAGLDGTVQVTPPADSTSAWVVAQDDAVWPVHYDQVAVDTGTGDVTSHTRWADYPLLAKLSKLGVSGHMGVLFGIANQIVLALVAIALVAVSLWGYRMWWQRRPTRDDRRSALGKAPARGTWRHVPLPALILGVSAVAALAWALPVLGVTLAGFLVVDAVAGAVRRARATP